MKISIKFPQFPSFLPGISSRIYCKAPSKSPPRYNVLLQAKAWGWKEVIHPEDLQYNLVSYDQILKGHAGGEFEVRVKRKDGEYRWHLIRIRPIRSEAGKIEQWIGTGTDIHDLKLLQDQKDDFISIASHELKTPVTSLKASLQIMDSMKNNPGTAFPKFIEQANRSVEK